MSSEKIGKAPKAIKSGMAGISDAVRAKRPLVHCITNYVTVNDCANALLASGGAPVMADDESEAAEIASIANALVINIGTLNERTIRSMLIAGKRAAERGIPVILDPVGAGASRLRTETALNLIREIPFAVIRGNVSEIRTLASGTGSTRGVDASDADAQSSGIAEICANAALFARKTGAVIAVTGATDVVTDGKVSYAIKNGHPLMSRITGSGCMLTAVIGAFAGANSGDRIGGVTAALCAMGLAGERAARLAQKKGTSSFRAALIDELSLMNGRSLEAGMRLYVL